MVVCRIALQFHTLFHILFIFMKASKHLRKPPAPTVHKWDKVLKNGPSKICGRQPSTNFTWSILEYLVSSVLRNSYCKKWSILLTKSVYYGIYLTD